MYKIIGLWFSFAVLLVANENFIVLSQSDTLDTTEQAQVKYQHILEADSDLSHLMAMTASKNDIVNVSNYYMLKVGPFRRNDILAIAYMTLKQSFPQAIILEENKAIVVSNTKVNIQKIYVDREVKVPVEKEDNTLWFALFALAFIGITFMFLSSEQIKRLKNEHEKIKSKHKKLEQKQHEVLSSMGENIHTIAKETMTHTSILAEKVKETPLYEDMEKVMYNENELLDVTGDLIKFLRLKSKKVVIQNEVFNFNNVLNEVAGLLNNTYKQNDTELVFDIDKKVPRFMLADSLHLGQILTNLLEYFIQNSKGKEIKLEVITTSSLKEGLQLQFHIDSEIMIEDKESIFDSYYDESSRRYVGLGLFVAKELTYLMDGELLVVDCDSGYNGLVLTLPIEEKNKEKRKYRLPDKGLVGKKILIVDKSEAAAIATEKMFSYFRADVKVLTAKKFGENIPNFSQYDIVALNDTLFNFKIIESLKQIKQKQGLKVISLENLFSSEEGVPNNVIDISLIKPLTQEYVFDTLIELYTQKETVSTEDRERNAIPAVPVHRDTFKDVKNVSLESFKKFKGAHVLIVEDNIINQKVVMSVLGKSEMVLSTAINGEEAVNFVRNSQEKIDFIFMDINMPVMDGYRASELIRNDNRFDHIAIVALTALVSEHEISKMFDSGMNGYLPKPVRIEKLYSALDVFLSKKEREVNVKVSADNDMNVDFEGLNIEDGLQHMKHNTMFYKEVLREFVDAYSLSDELFEKLVKEQRFTQVKMLCLDMKGLTGTIGAKEMHVIINEIHQHLIYKKPELLHSYVSRYRTTFTTLTKSIETYLAT
jgi:CheY-like chemotaxis protein/signal transduction histidine kinase